MIFSLSTLLLYCEDLPELHYIKERRKMNDFSVGYLAGIVDGEGCIYVNKRKPHGRRKTTGYSVKVCVSITSYDLVEWFIDNAKLSSIFHKKDPPGNRKPSWLCTWNASKAEWLLESILPHLVIKKRQAALGLELLRHLRQTPVNRGECICDEHLEYRESIKKKISTLNRRGKIDQIDHSGK